MFVQYFNGFIQLLAVTTATAAANCICSCKNPSNSIKNPLALWGFNPQFLQSITTPNMASSWWVQLCQSRANVYLCQGCVQNQLFCKQLLLLPLVLLVLQ